MACGGPGEEHLERLAREKNLAGVCPVVQEPAEKFFEHLRKGSEKYSTWQGELYLEKHQGTFTTQARSKRFNRKIEIALRELELMAVLAETGWELSVSPRGNRCDLARNAAVSIPRHPSRIVDPAGV